MKALFRHVAALAGILAVAFASPAGADMERDASEMAEDALEGGTSGVARGRFVAVPIPVANPTVGAGLQAALLYLHPKPAERPEGPNATTGLAGMYTNTGSWFVGGFHDGYSRNDRFRYAGLLGYGDFNLKFYGFGDNALLAANPLRYGLGGAVGLARVLTALPGTDRWFAGLQYLYILAETRIETSAVPPALPDLEVRTATAGLGLIAAWDTRNDNYYPTRGQLLRAVWTDYGSAWGGDFEYGKLELFLNHYQPVGKTLTVALRGRFQAADGRTPFYDLPYLDIRGFARTRYVDDVTLSLSAEGRYMSRSRLGGVAFVETGWIADTAGGLSSSPTIVSYGGGVRWRITREKSLNLGADLAFHDGEATFYVTVGEQY